MAGPELGAARAIGAIVFSVLIGLAMHFIYRREEGEKADLAVVPETDDMRPMWQNALYFGSMAGILVFANWGRPEGIDDGPCRHPYALGGFSKKEKPAVFRPLRDTLADAGHDRTLCPIDGNGGPGLLFFHDPLPALGKALFAGIHKTDFN